MNTLGPKGLPNTDSRLSAMDSRGLDALKVSARAEKGSVEYDAAIDKVAKQFESVFLQWTLKSMRQATPEGGLFTDSSSKTYQGMYDQELTQQLSGKGLGLASEIARQLKGLNVNIRPPGEGLNAVLSKPVTDSPSTLDKTGR